MQWWLEKSFGPFVVEGVAMSGMVSLEGRSIEHGWGVSDDGGREG
jgi:hypothetical protein